MDIIWFFYESIKPYILCPKLFTTGQITPLTGGGFKVILFVDDIWFLFLADLIPFLVEKNFMVSYYCWLVVLGLQQTGPNFIVIMMAHPLSTRETWARKAGPNKSPVRTGLEIATNSRPTYKLFSTEQIFSWAWGRPKSWGCTWLHEACLRTTSKKFPKKTSKKCWFNSIFHLFWMKEYRT
jgi:hypothetical protein